MYKYIYTYIYIYIYIYTFLNIYIHVHIYIYLFIFTLIVCVYIYLHIYIDLYMHIRICIYLHPYVRDTNTDNSRSIFERHERILAKVRECVRVCILDRAILYFRLSPCELFHVFLHALCIIILDPRCDEFDFFWKFYTYLTLHTELVWM